MIAYFTGRISDWIRPLPFQHSTTNKKRQSKTEARFTVCMQNEGTTLKFLEEENSCVELNPPNRTMVDHFNPLSTSENRV